MWSKLQKVFQEISHLSEGLSKSTSGQVSVVFNQYGDITVELGAYDIPGFSRHEFVGTFKDEKTALETTEERIYEAYKAVSKEYDIIDIPEDFVSLKEFLEKKKNNEIVTKIDHLKNLSKLDRILVAAVASFISDKCSNEDNMGNIKPTEEIWSFSTGEWNQHLFFTSEWVKSNPMPKTKEDAKRWYEGVSIHVYGEDHQNETEDAQLFEQLFSSYLYDYYSERLFLEENGRYMEWGKEGDSKILSKCGDRVRNHMRSMLLS